MSDDAKAPGDDPNATPISPNCVTVFGGGIAGLTAAHELVERGYHVQVWEPEINQRYPGRGCDVGGMARTQWSRVHWPEYRVVDQESFYDEDVSYIKKVDDKVKRFDRPPEQLAEVRATRPAYGKRVQSIETIDQKLYIRQADKRAKAAERHPQIFAALVEAGLAQEEDAVRQVVAEIIRFLAAHKDVSYVYAEICYLRPETKPTKLPQLIKNANDILKQLQEGLKGQNLFEAYIEAGERSVLVHVFLVEQKRWVTLELVVLDDSPYQIAPKETDVIVSFRVRERWLPGEHGYRFFPSFYNHLFDTMRRTPLLESADKSMFARAQELAVHIAIPEPATYVESGRTAYDNLRPLTSDLLAFKSGSRPRLLSRFRIRSFEELREWIRVLFGPTSEGSFGLGARDAARLTLKIVQYLTSSKERRVDYEKISWLDFVGGETLSAEAREFVENLPRALVAMDASSCDARSHGIGVGQLLLDQLRPDGYRDGALKGPTSEVWLNPWRRYLEAQGVEFIHGEITGFALTQVSNGPLSDRRLLPTVECYEPRYALRIDAPDTFFDPELLPGYFVLAVPPLEATKMARSAREALEAAGLRLDPNGDLAKLADWTKDIDKVEEDIRNPSNVLRDFRHFAGIQYYFAEDVFWLEGHVYYPDSAWSLTSVSQARFWDDRTDWEHGYRGLLSVIIGDWSTPGGTTANKPAAECKPEEIAKEVWAQLSKSIREDPRNTRLDAAGHANRQGDRASSPTPSSRVVDRELPQPLYWHLDDMLTMRRTESSDSEPQSGPPPYRNKSPFPITAPGRWDDRAGSVETTGYRVEYGIVCAGAHMKTFTRLPTMEAANESGRRAANGILNHCQSKHRRTLCDLWNPEDHEVTDFQWYKELDAALLKRGVPHVFDVIGIEQLTAELLRGGPGDPLDPATLWLRFQRLMASFRGSGAACT